MNKPTKTLAAILIEQKKPLLIVELELPNKLDVGQILVEFYYSGICGSQVGEIDGVKGEDRWLPHLLGHEGVGKVLGIGPGVTRFEPGDLVVAHWRPSLGIESRTPKYQWQGSVVNAGWVTTFNKHAIISENRLTILPDGADLKTAALYGCAITTGFGVVDNKAKIRLGESVVIFGAGGIGLNIVQAASLSGASTIVAVDIHENRLVIASKCGATVIVNAQNDDPWTKIKEIFPIVGPDIFIDNTGNVEIISRGFDVVNSMGRVVLVGVPRKNNSTAINTLDLHFGKSIIGTTGGEAVPHKDIPRYMNLHMQRNINLGSIVTDYGSLHDINSLIEKMKNGTASGRCMVDLRS